MKKFLNYIFFGIFLLLISGIVYAKNIPTMPGNHQGYAPPMYGVTDDNIGSTGIYNTVKVSSAGIMSVGGSFTATITTTTIMTSTVQETFGGTCSSMTATLVRNINTERTGLIILNTSDYTIYKSTYPATSIDGLLSIPTKGAYVDDGNPYVLAIYLLGSPGVATIDSIYCGEEKSK